MDQQTFNWVSTNAPWLLVVIVAFSILGWVLRILNDWSPMVKKVLGPLGDYWARKSANRFIRSGADYENMNKQILYLYTRVHHLEYESQLDHTFRVEDENWHRAVDLMTLREDIPQRKTFGEFREEYERRFPYRKPDVTGE
jgi:hypothetical protein